MKMILIKSKAIDDVNDDIADDNDDIFLKDSDDFDHLAVGVLCKFKAPWQKKVRDELDWIWMLGDHSSTSTSKVTFGMNCCFRFLPLFTRLIPASSKIKLTSSTIF